MPKPFPFDEIAKLSFSLSDKILISLLRAFHTTYPALGLRIVCNNELATGRDIDTEYTDKHITFLLSDIRQAAIDDLKQTPTAENSYYLLEKFI